MKKEEVEYQLVPPHVHRCNAAERAIRTFKNHFIAGLCSLDNAFSLFPFASMGQTGTTGRTHLKLTERIKNQPKTINSMVHLITMPHRLRHQEHEC